MFAQIIDQYIFCYSSIKLLKEFYMTEYAFIYSSGSQTVVRVPLVVREGFSGGTRAAFLSYSKRFVNSFLCYNSLLCYANVANSFICYINVKYIWANYVLLKPRGVHSNIKKTLGGTRSQKVWEPLP